MKHILPIHADEAADAAAGEDAITAMVAGYGRFTGELAEAGRLGPAEELEADSMEEAERWAAKVRSATHGTIEVRPLAAGEMPG